MKGMVTLIGAGPGDPGLLTLRGRDALAAADVVIYDALVNPRLLDWAKAGAPRLYVGKRGGSAHSMRQIDINDLLLKHARRGLSVARLKGGDPFLFGRGGEEAAFLRDHGVPFEIVPGVSSALGAAAYAGIPLTDRRLGSMVTFVTGHEGKDKEAAPVDWAKISPHGTLVVFMGLEQLATITTRLLNLGWSARLPAAVIRWGTMPGQGVLEGTLGDIAARAKQGRWTSPVLIVVGRVAGLRGKLKWFERRPLFGKRIVITRAADQAPEFARLLESLGAEVIGFPTIEIVPPKTWAPVDAAIRRLESFDWLLFTSVNGVTAFMTRLQTLGIDIRALQGVRIGAIGPKTSARLAAFGLKVDAFPAEYRAEALADVIGHVRGAEVLLARAEQARDVLPDTLRQRGAKVAIVTVYRTLKRTDAATSVKRRLLAGEIDAVTFTSSSTVEGFLRHFSPAQRRALFRQTKAAAIGPITGQTLRDAGIRPAIQSKRYTIEALAQAIVKGLR